MGETKRLALWTSSIPAIEVFDPTVLVRCPAYQLIGCENADLRPPLKIGDASMLELVLRA